MSRAVYAKIWASTAQFTQRRHYAWYQVGTRVGKWAMPLGAWWAWLLFPALPEEYRSAITFGIWKKPDVGTQTKDF